MSQPGLIQLIKCCPNLEFISVSDRLPQPQAGSEMFQVAVIHKHTGHKTVISNPLLKEQAEILCAKLTVYPWRTHVIEKAAV